METNTTLTAVVEKSFKKIMIIGIIVAVLGIVAIIYSKEFGKISVTTIGEFMVIGGLLRLAFATVSPLIETLFMPYLCEILMIIAGIWVIGNTDLGLKVLTIVMAVYFIIDGITLALTGRAVFKTAQLTSENI